MFAFVKALCIYIITTLIITLSVLPPAVSAKENYSPLNASQWSYATDPYGSKANINKRLVTDQGVWVNFKRIPRVDAKRNSWIEVIYSPEAATLANTQRIKLTYKCDIPLLIKLSQKHYGTEGDKSYAHYQIKLPAARQWRTEEVDFSGFSRPDWTPKSSIDHGIVLEQINALYLTPSMTDEQGGEATLQIRALELIQ